MTDGGPTQLIDRVSKGRPSDGWFPANAHPPGLGLSSPQPDADHLARWVRFLAPRPWM